MISWLRDRLLTAYIRGPGHPGKYRVVRSLGKRVFPEQGIRARAHPDLELTLHPRDWIEYLLLTGEAYEPLTLEFLTKNLRPGDVAVMAGVNFGQHVAVAARAVGDSGVVVGVEPQPAALLRAAENLRLNGLQKRVKLVGVALGSEAGFLPMRWSSPGNTGAASLLDPGDGLTVAIVPLSRILIEICPRTPRVLLLDVQGFEAHALAGMGADRRPEMVVVELDPEFLTRSNTTAEQLLAMIRDLGYELWTLAGVKVDSDAVPLPERNVVGVRSGCQVAWVAPPPG